MVSPSAQRILRLALATLAAVLLSASAAWAAPTAATWDAAQQREVVQAGLMSNLGDSFDGSAPLSTAAADRALAALRSRLGPATAPAVLAGRGPVTVSRLDGLLVDQLGLRDVAAHLQAAATGAGLAPPSYFGTEVVARFLNLRYNHPAGSDNLELFPTQAITRAETAWSLATVLHMGSWAVPDARQTLSSFALPRLDGAQRTVLRIAVSRIGYPYVWGGTTDDTADGLAHGGFDCSGFIWRVYKVSGLPWGREIHGRTAAQQAGEIPRSRRLAITRLRPGDLLFFGSAHFGSTATESDITHEGLYLGDNWVIHASDQGVYVLPLRGSWLGSTFAWGRRVL